MSDSSDFRAALNLFYSPNERVRSRASKYIFSLAFTEPKALVAHIPEIHLLISSLCSTPVPSWGTITSLCNAVAIAVNMMREAMSDSVFIDLVEISYEVTRTVLTVSNESVYTAILWPITNVILAFYQPTRISLDLFLAITDHCILGFLPHASLIHVLIDGFPHCLDSLESLSSETYEHIAQPLSSRDDQIVHFYLLLWTFMMKSMADRPIVVRALATQCDRLVLLAGQRDFSDLAKVLLDCIRLSPIDKRSVKQLASEKYEHAIVSLKGSRQRLDSGRRLSDYIDASKPKKIYQHMTADVAVQTVPKGIGKRKKWSDRQLVLLDEAGIIFWTATENLMQKGGAFHCSEIDQITALRQGEKEQGKENVMRIQTVTKDWVLIAFKSFNICNLWKNAISAQRDAWKARKNQQPNNDC